MYRRQGWRRILYTVAVTTAILVVAILPFTIFNYLRFERFVLLNTNAGYAFFWANHPIYGTQFRPASEMGTTYQALVPEELRHLDEAALDQELLKLGLQFVVEEPGRYLLLSASRIPHYFKFWPDPASGLISNLSRVASFALFLPFMLYGLVRPFFDTGRGGGELRVIRPTAAYLLLYLFVLVYTAIHVLSWAQIRYRLPVDAVLVTFAAIGLQDVTSRLRARQKAGLSLERDAIDPVSKPQRRARQQTPS
jgi:hypothetical protein